MVRKQRWWVIVLVLQLLLGGLGFRVPGVRAIGVWIPIAPLSGLQPLVSALLLHTGQILVTSVSAGNNDLSSDGTVATYDPATDRWSARVAWPYAQGYTAPTQLPNGRVLFTGGYLFAPGVLNTAQLYDPTTAAWRAVAPMRVARFGHTATLLADGAVLVVGGQVTLGATADAFTGAVERFDPAKGLWTELAPLRVPRGWHTATRLPDGRVLITGGRTASGPTATSEIYDPIANTWTPVARMARPRALPQATLLQDGRVLVTGGLPGDRAALSIAEVYEPAADRWTPTGPMTTPRARDTLTLLPTGQVLAVGGIAGDDPSQQPLRTTELYDPRQNVWAAAAPLTTPRQAHVATVLPDGRVLVIGGATADTAITAEAYTPTQPPETCFPETGKCVRGPFLTYWQAHGGLAVNGYPLSDEFTQVLEDGKSYTVQYFERVRLEYHPENPPPYDILLGQFGRRILQERTGQSVAPPAAPLPGQAYFPETGHSLGGDFLQYWQANGGLMQFGFPISEVFTEQLADGKSYQVQYFERARFEAHPENQPPWNIELGQFGRRILAESGAAPGQAPNCTGADLSGRAGWQGAGGALAGSVVLTNRGATACRLAGRPALAIRDAAGNALATQPATLGADPTQEVVLQPGQRAVVRFVWRNWCAAPPTGPFTLAVTVPESQDTVTAPVLDAAGQPQSDTPRCDAPGTPSTLAVGTIQPDTGP